MVSKNPKGEDQISAPTDRIDETLDPGKRPMLKGKEVRPNANCLRLDLLDVGFSITSAGGTGEATSTLVALDARVLLGEPVLGAGEKLDLLLLGVGLRLRLRLGHRLSHSFTADLTAGRARETTASLAEFHGGIGLGRGLRLGLSITLSAGRTGEATASLAELHGGLGLGLRLRLGLSIALAAGGTGEAAASLAEFTSSYWLGLGHGLRMGLSVALAAGRAREATSSLAELHGGLWLRHRLGDGITLTAG